MALIVLMSASGSPGVTTSSLGLALSWPRPVVLVDADPTGARAVLAGYFGGAQFPSDRTIVDLAVSHRQGTLAADLPGMVTPVPQSRVQFLPGPLNHYQAGGLENLWDPLSGAFKALERNGQDVIVDAGRLGLHGSAMKLITQADLALLTVRSTLPALVAASSWAATLRDEFARVGAPESLGGLVVGAGHPYGERDVSNVLKMPVVASLAWDSAAADVYSLGASQPRKFESSKLPKSLRAAVQSIQTTVDKTRTRLESGAGERSAL